MPPIQLIKRRRLMVVAWLITWITTVPLFHIHVPDATDRWSALQSGGAHTVLTPDLPGEFFHPFHDSQQGHTSHLSNRTVNSPEIGMAILDDPDERKVKALHVLDAQSNLSDRSLQSRDVWASPDQFHQLQLFQEFPGSRAPPQIV